MHGSDSKSISRHDVCYSFLGMVQVQLLRHYVFLNKQMHWGATLFFPQLYNQ